MPPAKYYICITVASQRAKTCKMIEKEGAGSPGRTRTCNPSVNSCDVSFSYQIRSFAIYLFCRHDIEVLAHARLATKCAHF